MNEGMTASLLAFATAMVASLGLTVPVRQFALRVGMVDHPGPRKVHLQPIPLLGGIAIYSGVLLGMVVSSGSQALTQILGILAGATLVILVGTLDDRGLLHHQIKLFVGMPIAALILVIALTTVAWREIRRASAAFARAPVRRIRRADNCCLGNRPSCERSSAA